MPQVTIYLDEKVRDTAQRAAKLAGTSLSRWVASAVEEKARDQWPEDILAACGAFKDFPLAEEIRSRMGVDAPREKL
jgi:hypothetical protein